MNPDELTETNAELEAFVDDVFASLPRSVQRAKGNLYLRGLMLDGRRKSMQPMGTRLGIDYQQLEQFVSSSPWKKELVRRVLVRRALQLIGPDAWVVDDTGFKKGGAFSPCVARQYSGTLGKVGNCQIGVSIHVATDHASCPLDWRLDVPQLWDDSCADTSEEAETIVARRAKAQLPETQRYRTKWAMALEMIDELAAWGHRPPALVGDAGYGEITAFRCGLSDRQIPYMVVSESIHERVPRRRRHGRAQAGGAREFGASTTLGDLFLLDWRSRSPHFFPRKGSLSETAPRSRIDARSRLSSFPIYSLRHAPDGF